MSFFSRSLVLGAVFLGTVPSPASGPARDVRLVSILSGGYSGRLAAPGQRIDPKMAPGLDASRWGALETSRLLPPGERAELVGRLADIVLTEPADGYPLFAAQSLKEFPVSGNEPALRAALEKLRAKGLESASTATRGFAAVAVAALARRLGEKAAPDRQKIDALLFHEGRPRPNLSLAVQVQLAEALMQLGGGGKVERAIVDRALVSEDGWARDAAVKALGVIGSAETLGVLMKTVGDAKLPVELRQSAVSTLRGTGHPAALKLFEKMLVEPRRPDEMDPVYEHVARTLVHFPDREAMLAAVSRAVSAPTMRSWLKGFVITHLAETRSPGVVPILKALALDPTQDDLTRSRAVAALCTVTSLASHAALLEIWQKGPPDADMQKMVLGQLEQSAPSMLMPKLRATLNDKSAALPFWRIAVESLGRIAKRDPAAGADLLAYFRNTKNFFNRRGNVGEALGESGLTEAIPDIVAYLKDTVNGNSRTAALVAAAMRLSPKDALPPLLAHLKQGDFPFNTVVLDAVERYLPDINEQVAKEKRFAADEAEFRKLFAQPKLSACAATCRLLETLPKWATNDNFGRKDYILGGDAEDWQFAMKAIGSLFVVRAAPLCKEPQLRDGVLLHWYDAKTKKVFDDSEDYRKVATGTKDRLSEIAGKVATYRPELLPGKMKWGDRTLVGKVPMSNVPGYGLMYHSVLVRELRDAMKKAKGGEKAAAALTVEVDDSEALLAAIVSQFDDFAEEEGKNPLRSSYFHTHLTAMAGLALPSPPKGIVDRFNDILKEVPETPLELPYFPKVLQLRNDLKGSAARAVVFHQLLYKYDKNPKNAELRRRNLISALENFNRHSPSLRAHMWRNLVHQGPSGIAPYYYQVTTEPFQAAVADLLEDKELKQADRQRVFDIGRVAANDQISLIRDDGTVMPNGVDTYPSSPAYLNPLAGLGLARACRNEQLARESGLTVQRPRPGGADVHL